MRSRQFIIRVDILFIRNIMKSAIIVLYNSILFLPYDIIVYIFLQIGLEKK